jgi:hypothetical protein
MAILCQLLLLQGLLGSGSLCAVQDRLRDVTADEMARSMGASEQLMSPTVDAAQGVDSCAAAREHRCGNMQTPVTSCAAMLSCLPIAVTPPSSAASIAPIAPSTIAALHVEAPASRSLQPDTPPPRA